MTEVKKPETQWQVVKQATQVDDYGMQYRVGKEVPLPNHVYRKKAEAAEAARKLNSEVKSNMWHFIKQTPPPGSKPKVKRNRNRMLDRPQGW